MKIILAGLFLLSSVSVFAARECTNTIGIRVCADITKVGENIAITNISPDIQKKTSVARELCAAAGDQFSDYKLDIVTKKSCNYYATKGFFAEGMVSACNDFGGISRGTVFAKIKCLKR